MLWMALVTCMGEAEVEVEASGVEIQAEEETEARKITTTPSMPSAKEVEEHRLDHMPYRSWCDQCVEGRGKERSHTAVDKSKNVISCIGAYRRMVLFRRSFWFERAKEMDKGRVTLPMQYHRKVWMNTSMLLIAQSVISNGLGIARCC